jgi:glutamine cyclotransferase
MKSILYSILLITIIGCTGNSSNSDSSKEEQQPRAVPAISYTVTAEYPHSTQAFTEGLVFHNGEMYESTGSPEEFPETESMVGVVNL